ncbi:hypothetical protein ES332_A07G131000v1 [Gossypium tomentosum]|uniref:Uncharacterized protein n=1 Tax=Gossypium tomentosum TaxID=34277 RepID=A0A5D2PVL0_GOSTO|nr:hypothetical protein ES332_A07G131000v1 [Gossypium tomentosum]
MIEFKIAIVCDLDLQSCSNPDHSWVVGQGEGECYKSDRFSFCAHQFPIYVSILH